MKKFVIFLTVITLSFCTGGDKKAINSSHNHEHETPKHQEPPGQKHEGEEHEHQELKLPPEKQKQWEIETGELSELYVSSKIKLPGVISLNQNKTAHISSLAEGKVVSLSADLGDTVQKGQVLLTINSIDFAQAQVDFLQARARFLLSHKELERAKKLLEEKAIEEKEFLKREAEFERARTEYGARGSNLHSYGLDHEQIDALIDKCESIDPEGYQCDAANPHLTILSPISGKIIFRDVINGEHIEPNKVLFTISNLNTLWALLDAYETDLPYITYETRVTITSSLYPDERFSGKITNISDTIDAKLRTAKIRVEVENRGALLKPNLYIEGIMENTAERKKILALPEEAIQNMNGEKIVFVMEEEGVFAVREVKLGKKVGNLVVIAHGLKTGEKIVLKGAFNLKAELTKKSFGQTHVH